MCNTINFLIFVLWQQIYNYFFHLGKGDKVKCFFCAGILSQWKELDVPIEEHKLYYPACPFIKNIGEWSLQTTENSKISDWSKEKYYTVDMMNIQNEHYKQYLINKMKLFRLCVSTDHNLQDKTCLWQTSVACTQD